MFFPQNSFVINTTLTYTNTPRSHPGIMGFGNDHIACYGGDPQAAHVTWHDSSGGQLLECRTVTGPTRCLSCGPRCRSNHGVGVDVPLNGHTNVHVYTDSDSYLNQDLECRASDSQSAVIGVYLKNGGGLVSCKNSLSIYT